MADVSAKVIEDFGREWQKFAHAAVTREEELIFEAQFAIFPWKSLPANARGFDLGCGSGRWARHVAPRVGWLECIDPSAAALEVARRNLGEHANCRFHLAPVEAILLPDDSADFGYSLGVLHHVADTQAGIAACVRKLKTGAPLLLYLYYAFDNRPRWFRRLWRASNLVRAVVSSAPNGLKLAVCELIAAFIYWPLARMARLAENRGQMVDGWPLSDYRARSFYMMRNDALDRFGTRVEKRFTQAEIRDMMLAAGLCEIEFSPNSPYWCAVGRKQANG